MFANHQIRYQAAINKGSQTVDRRWPHLIFLGGLRVCVWWTWWRWGWGGLLTHSLITPAGSPERLAEGAGGVGEWRGSPCFNGYAFILETQVFLYQSTAYMNYVKNDCKTVFHNQCKNVTKPNIIP